MTDQTATAAHFLDLHHQLEQRGRPLLLPNPWDRGTALALQGMGFEALATTSAGHAATLGRFDGLVSLDEAIDHAGELAATVDVPVSVDFENGYGHRPEDVAANAARLIASGIAGFSVEDYVGDEVAAAERPSVGGVMASGMYEPSLAQERVAAAVEVAHAAGGPHIVVTARAENHIRDVDDLDDTISRLQLFQDVGADVLYAPGPSTSEDIGRIVSEVELPVNVLSVPGAPSVAELAELGVARLSVGSGFSLAALGGLADAARELLEAGTYGFWDQAGRGAQLRRSFEHPPDR